MQGERGHHTFNGDIKGVSGKLREGYRMESKKKYGESVLCWLRSQGALFRDKKGLILKREKG